MTNRVRDTQRQVGDGHRHRYELVDTQVREYEELWGLKKVRRTDWTLRCQYCGAGPGEIDSTRRHRHRYELHQFRDVVQQAFVEFATTGSPLHHEARVYTLAFGGCRYCTDCCQFDLPYGARALPAPKKREGPTKPVKRGAERDFQRERVYAWERQHAFPSSGVRPYLSLPRCRGLVRRVFAAYGKPAPKVSGGRCGAGRGVWYSETRAIVLPEGQRYAMAVLHECAHALAEDDAPGEGGHGPTFMRWYIDLLVRFGRCSRKKLTGTAEKAGLKIAEHAEG